MDPKTDIGTNHRSKMKNVETSFSCRNRLRLRLFNAWDPNKSLVYNLART